MTKVEMTTPRCPECEAEMDETKEGDGAVWLCNQRPECGGRRDVRKYRKGLRVVAQDAGIGADTAATPEPVSEGVAPAPSKKSAQRKVTLPGETAGAVSTPPAAPGQQRVFPPKTQEAIAKPAPGTAQNGGKGTSADARNIRSIAPDQQRESPPEFLRGKPKPDPNAAQGEGAVSIAGDTPPSATSSTSNPPPSPSKPAPIPAEGEIKEKSGYAGAVPWFAPCRQSVAKPAAQAVNPNPAPVPVRAAGAKRNGGLLSSVVDEFKRRGFRLEETPLAKPKPAPPKQESNAA
jgi:ssDNA-binding Zn-finger/Zn-ribbon topoisomerase 1